MARRLNEEDPDDDKNPGTPPVTRRPSEPGILMSRYLVYGFLAFSVVVLAGSLAFTIVSSKRAAPEPEEPEEERRLFRRSDWKATPPISVVLHRSPAQYVVISQTATGGCAVQAQCLAVVHTLQTWDLKRGYLDITCNFLVGDGGTVYEGRGWGVRCPHTHVRKTSSLGVCLIGTFTQRAPSEDQLDATRRLIREGVEYGHIATNYTLLADFDQKAPDFLSVRQGNMLLEELSTWPHWSAGS